MKKLNLTYTLFFILLPIASITGTVILIYNHMIYYQTILLAFIFFNLTMFATATGYHRSLSHRSYVATWPVRLIIALFGAAAIQSSAIEWASDHRNHHLYTDTNKDPYPIAKGFWYAHIGWLFVLDPKKRDLSNVKDLFADPILRFQQNHHTTLALLVGVVLPIVISLAWGDPIGGLVIAVALRICLAHHFFFSINSFAHYFGDRPYPKHSATNNWITALFIYGDGYHNFHHQFPLDYRAGYKLYHYDPQKWVIWLLSKVGLTRDLKRVTDFQIVKHKIMQDYHFFQEVIVNMKLSYANIVNSFYLEMMHLLQKLSVQQ